MKVFSILLLAAFASADIDWENVRPVMEMNGFWEGRDLQLFKAPAGVVRDKRIVNGDIAEPHQFPYQVCVI